MRRVPDDGVTPPEVRLRFEGIFRSSTGALALSMALGGLGVGGPAGVCGGFMGGAPHGTPVTSIAKELVPRADALEWTWAALPALAHAAGATKARERSDSGDCVCVNDCIIDVDVVRLLGGARQIVRRIRIECDGK